MTQQHSMAQKRQVIGIYGGTFDPIHNGHIVCAQYVRETFSLDKVIFLPTGQPPHKTEKGISNNVHRYEMTKLAISDNKYFDISDIEMTQNDITYTIDTLRKIKLKYKNAEIFFIMGADSAVTFHFWKDFEKLIEEFKFIAAVRPGISDEELDKKIKKYGFFKANMPIVDISSSMIRDKVLLGKSIRNLVPEKVEKYIKNESLYLHSLTNTKNFDKIKKNLSEELQIHILNVAKTAVNLAKRWNVDESKAEIAALLHDVAKEMSTPLGHSKDARDIAQKEFEINDDDILNSIAFHTTGRAGMCTLEKIIYLADMIEPGRDYDEVEILRKLSYENIDKAMLFALERTKNYVNLRGLTLDSDTQHGIDYFRKEKNGEYKDC